MKHIVCYSGGHSSALVAVEVVRKYGKENVILLNHNISSKVEHKDIKRFKGEVADYLGIPIIYANMNNWENETPLDVCMRIGAFKVGNGTALCTNRLKTQPFQDWLKKEFPANNGVNNDCTVYYGFDKGENIRIKRRSDIMATMGYKTDYPLAYWERTIHNIEDIGINRPITYECFRHANCIGCLKAGKQQWYIVYCLYPNLWTKAKGAEKKIGYSILKDNYLIELESKFERMKQLGIVPNEKVGFQKFWAMVRKILKENVSTITND
ncbi:hypothetical protein SH1V18_03460 [Vallitalea longa]|uniref:Phosphoadenosine phosphosulphate reductase domain-containing protein n=1 Tax=Vallitalea longa TaxID=2936439 RepID=A0A9W5Y8L6_9FIRM|nr:hypothetical protein [Vallitalea longa]GKX27866.1 hypothetical protein SH1V18_03460 [Vallitalea longa]